MTHDDHQTEVDPLISSSPRQTAHPYWLIPVIVFASMARGMTLASRIQVFKDIACKAILSEGRKCDPLQVQPRAAAVQALVMTVMSVLSAISTGPWSRFGDVNGRKPVLAITLSGALMMETTFILAYHTPSVAASYAFVVIGAVLDGAVGGLSVFNGVIHAYTSDCTEHGSRSQIFSTLQGIVFIGLALGPWVGGILVTKLSFTVYMLFYVSVTMLFLLVTFVALLLPESLKVDRPATSNTLPALRLSSSYLRGSLKSLFSSLLAPITIFLPRQSIHRPGHRDYNVTCVGAALFVYLISIGVYQIKYLYATHVYEWTTTQLSYYMSLLWITRAINLLVFLPIVIPYFRPKKESRTIFADMRFDSILARCSLFVDGTADFLIAITPTTSSIPFIFFSCVSSFTSGGNPALHSLGAVCLHAAGRSSEVGSLFGAMAFLSAVAHVISPTLYAVIYGSTVANLPQAIFFMATALLMISVAFVTALRSEGSPAGYSQLAAEDDRID